MIVRCEFMTIIEERDMVGLKDNFEGGFIPETEIVPYELLVLHELVAVAALTTKVTKMFQQNKKRASLPACKVLIIRKYSCCATIRHHDG
jgi:hypothetical protein